MSKIIFPAGLLIPHFSLDDTKGEFFVDRLRIRRDNQSNPKYHMVAGSRMTPLCIDVRHDRPAFIVESDLDALLLAQMAGDLIGVIAMGSVSTRPDAKTYRLLKSLPLIIVALDSDMAGAKESHRYWNEHFPKCVRCLIPRRYGKDPGEAYHNGHNIRLWVVSALELAGWPLVNVPANNNAYPETPRPSGAPTEKSVTETTNAGPQVASIRQQASTPSETNTERAPELSCVVAADNEIPGFEYVADADAANTAVEALLAVPGTWGADIETAKHPDHVGHSAAGLDPYLSKIRLVQLYAPGGPVYVFDLFRVDPSILAPLWGHPMIFHNALFDIRHLLLAGANPTKVGCTMLMDNCLSGELRSLATLTAEYLGLEVSKEQQVSDWSADTLTEEQLSYAALDAYLVHCLHVRILARITEEGLGRCYKLMRNSATRPRRVQPRCSVPALTSTVRPKFLLGSRTTSVRRP